MPVPACARRIPLRRFMQRFLPSLLLHSLLIVAAILALTPLLWMISLPAAPVAKYGHLRALHGAVHPPRSGSLPAQQYVAGRYRDPDFTADQFDGWLCLRQIPVPGSRSLVSGSAGRAGDSGAGGDVAAVPAAQAIRPDQHLGRGDDPRSGQHLRHFPDPAIPAGDPRTVRANFGSTGRWRCRCVGPFWSPWQFSPFWASGMTSCGR